jgi:hypothetical protein
MGGMMNKGDLDVSNEYARNARLKPAFLVGLPLAMLAAGFGLKSSVVLGAVTGPLTAAGFTYLLAHVTRDFGIRKQAGLFSSWGGKPSMTKLRHRDRSLNPHTRSRYHAKATEMLGRAMPTAAEEDANPAAADSVYEAYSNLLLERTRDTKTYRLLFEELMSYGFRRNLFGMKAIGLCLCLLCTLVETVFLIRGIQTAGQIEISTAVFVTLDFFLLLCWWFVIRPDWVRRGAEAYAERLLATSETLPTSMKGSPRSSARSTKRAVKTVEEPSA